MGTESNSVEAVEEARIADGDRHRILASEHRRTTIAVLRSATTPIALDALAARVVDRNEGLAGMGIDAEENVAIGLHHNHLPLLDEMGVLAYDTNAKYVDTIADLDPLVE